MKLFATLLHFLRSLSPFHFQRGTVCPDSELLIQDRQIFRSPLVQHSFVSDLLASNKDFLNAIPNLGEDLLLIAAVCGRSIKVNAFLVERDPTLRPVFNDHWMNQGYFHFYLEPNGKFGLLRRPVAGHYYHDEDARMSFCYDLSVDEYDTLKPMLMSHVPSCTDIPFPQHTDTTNLMDLRRTGTVSRIH